MLNIKQLVIFFLFAISFQSCSDKYSEVSDKEILVKENITESSNTVSNIDSTSLDSKDTPVSKNKFAVSIFDTPVLNTPEFETIYGGNDGRTLKFSKSGLVKELEYVAYPGAVFKIIEEIQKDGYSVYKVETDEYDIVLGGTELFVDSRFVETKDKKPEKKMINKPAKDQIYEYFDKSIGADYVWGANNLDGVDKMLEYYKPNGNISSSKFNHWCMKGVDCSGLIYEATGGYTPRNTHQMVTYGEGVNIKGKSPIEIAEMLEPLDMIVWKGHVIYVYDKNTSIQSAHSDGGVVKKDLRATIEKLMQTRRPVNEWSDNSGKIFVVRRWW